MSTTVEKSLDGVVMQKENSLTTRACNREKFSGIFMHFHSYLTELSRAFFSMKKSMRNREISSKAKT